MEPSYSGYISVRELPAPRLSHCAEVWSRKAPEVAAGNCGPSAEARQSCRLWPSLPQLKQGSKCPAFRPGNWRWGRPVVGCGGWSVEPVASRWKNPAQPGRLILEKQTASHAAFPGSMEFSLANLLFVAWITCKFILFILLYNLPPGVALILQSDEFVAML